MNEGIKALLDEVFYPAVHGRWLNTPRHVWGGKTAQQMIDNGHGVAVERYLDALAEGVVL